MHFAQGGDYAYSAPDAYITQWVLYEYSLMSEVDVQQIRETQ